MKDYEKKYKEALERAKKYKLKEDLIITQDIFPELKESEDEKIKEELKAHVGLLCDGLFPQKKDWLSWIEKQGKQKSYASETMNEKGDFDNGFTKMMEREQKPTWSEEDEKYWPIIIAEFSKCAGKSVSKDEWMRCNDWLNSLRDRVLVQLQPKQEWSEEDETNASYICAALDCYLRLREDRNNTNGQGDLDKARNWLYNRLKSLKPQNRWKPSDEQMIALQEAMNIVGILTITGSKINSLYQDLKKLREE